MIRLRALVMVGYVPSCAPAVFLAVLRAVFQSVFELHVLQSLLQAMYHVTAPRGQRRPAGAIRTRSKVGDMR